MIANPEGPHRLLYKNTAGGKKSKHEGRISVTTSQVFSLCVKRDEIKGIKVFVLLQSNADKAGSRGQTIRPRLSGMRF